MTLSKAATVHDVLDTLPEPTEYVRRILGAFVEHQVDRDRSVVRIGVSGSGAYPNYAIETPYPAGQIQKSVDIGDAQVSERFERRLVFNGRSHREVSDDVAIGEKWSSASLTYADIQALLGHLRQTSPQKQ